MARPALAGTMEVHTYIPWLLVEAGRGSEFWAVETAGMDRPLGGHAGSRLKVPCFEDVDVDVDVIVNVNVEKRWK